MGRRWQKSDYAREREIRENNKALMQKWRDMETAKAGSSRCDVCDSLVDYQGVCRECGDVGE